MFRLKLLRHKQLSKTIILLCLLVLVGGAAVPSYLTWQWPWTKPSQIATLNQLQSLGKAGVSLPGWRSLQAQTVKVGGRKWLAQAVQQETATVTAAPVSAILLLLPQQNQTEQPQVEWTDVNGFEQWYVDSEEYRQFIAQFLPAGSLPANKPQAAKVTARFFRGWTQQQTYAVLQWYAWPLGGHPAPSHWFWSDQLTRWRSNFHSKVAHRTPWVAVSLQVPIQPLGEVEQAWPLVQPLAQAVQAALMAGPLSSTP